MLRSYESSGRRGARACDPAEKWEGEMHCRGREVGSLRTWPHTLGGLTPPRCLARLTGASPH